MTISSGMGGPGLRASSTLIEPLLEIHHQPLPDERIDPIIPSPPRSSREGGDFEVADRARAERELATWTRSTMLRSVMLLRIDRRAERQLQVAGDAQADRGGVGAAVDDEMIGAAAVYLHFDRHPRFDLARVDVVAADRERLVDHGGRSAAAWSTGRAARAGACRSRRCVGSGGAGQREADRQNAAKCRHFSSLCEDWYPISDGAFTATSYRRTTDPLDGGLRPSFQFDPSRTAGLNDR